jgi:hypothetical protein
MMGGIVSSLAQRIRSLLQSIEPRHDRVARQGGVRIQDSLGASDPADSFHWHLGQVPVPEGHLTIAQRFNVGFDQRRVSFRPEGTVDPHQVSRWLERGMCGRGVVARWGHCQPSLRDSAILGS